MAVTIHVYHHFETENPVTKRLDQITEMLRSIQRKEEAFMKEFDDLVVQVTETKGVVDSVKTLVTGVIAKINEIITQLANTTDPVQVAALTAELKTLTADLQASAADLAAAVPANA